MALALRGVNYDTGTAYVGGSLSRSVWNLDDVRRDMRAIVGDLHCTHVAVYGTDTARLLAATRIALDAGLDVCVQRRVVDVGADAMRAAVLDCAGRLAQLDAAGRLIVNLGCEASLFTTGFLPGGDVFARMRALGLLWPVLLPFINNRLNKLLRRLAGEVRAVFDGPLTYSSGTWESIHWETLDLVGVDLYRDRDNERNYVGELRRYLSHGKPLLITEFGCCTFEGAERMGGMGWSVVDHQKDPPEIRPGHVRSEAVQARYIAELTELFETEGVHGAFVFSFIEPDSRHTVDPRYDLDMACYGLVKVLSGTDAESIQWAPKQAFHTVAERFAAAQRPG